MITQTTHEEENLRAQALQDADDYWSMRIAQNEVIQIRATKRLTPWNKRLIIWIRSILRGSK